MTPRKNGRLDTSVLADRAIDVIALSLGIALGGSIAWAAVPVVQQKNKLFDPGRVEISRGESVQFTNDDPFIHHLYIEAPNFTYDSGDQRPGRTIKIAFDQPGEYVLKCAIHLKMQLEILVK